MKNTDNKFGEDLLKGEGKIIIPNDYKPKIQIDTFGKKLKRLKTFFFNDNLTDKKWEKVTDIPKFNKTYGVMLIPILDEKGISSEDCLIHMKKQAKKIYFFGVQGLTLLQGFQPKIFPVGKGVVSFDEKKSLWKDIEGSYRVPYVHHLNDSWWFFLGYFEGKPWNFTNTLLIFYELENK